MPEGDKDTKAEVSFRCTYPECGLHFETIKEMKRHKVNEPNHNYCKKCDVDCADWEGLTQHKVNAMQPFLEGRMRHNTDASPMHIACEFCGQDFKSFGGRELHRKQVSSSYFLAVRHTDLKQAHPAEQNIKCPGCGTLFARASNLIAHFENNQCEAITSRDFFGNVLQKHVVTEVMKDPQKFVEYRQGDDTDQRGLIRDGSETQDTEEGGVALLDQENEAQKGGYKPLQAEVDLINMNPPLTRSNLETWPRLSGQPSSQLTESMRTMSIGSAALSVSGTDMSAIDVASEITSRRGGTKVYTESYPSLSSPAYSASVDDDDETASQVSTTVASSTNRPSAWITGSSSKALFKDAQPTPRPGDWKAILQQREEAAMTDQSTNLFHARFWDRSSDDWDMHFKDPVTGQWCCPIQDCDSSYDTCQVFEEHFLLAHVKRTDYRCPACLKIFYSPSALIGHSESSGKCRVRDSALYDKLLDEVSGGFLKAKQLKQPKIYRPDKALVRKGEQPINGVMSTKFTAKIPEER